MVSGSGVCCRAEAAKAAHYTCSNRVLLGAGGALQENFCGRAILSVRNARRPKKMKIIGKNAASGKKNAENP
jgi:hypothetical protein